MGRAAVRCADTQTHAGRNQFAVCLRQSDTVGDIEPVTDTNALTNTCIAHP